VSIPRVEFSRGVLEPREPILILILIMWARGIPSIEHARVSTLYIELVEPLSGGEWHSSTSVRNAQYRSVGTRTVVTQKASRDPQGVLLEHRPLILLLERWN
jgi:hypothetical protein